MKAPAGTEAPPPPGAVFRAVAEDVGHTEIVRQDDGDFTGWEQQHMPVFREPVPAAGQ